MIPLRSAHSGLWLGVVGLSVDVACDDDRRTDEEHADRVTSEGAGYAPCRSECAASQAEDCVRAEPLAAISVSGMTSRLTDDRLPEVGQIVREVAREMTIALGGAMPTSC